MRTKTKIDPAALYEAIMSFSGELDGHSVVYNPGWTVRGDNAAVKKWPAYFILADASTEEKRKAYNALAGPLTVPDPAPVGRVIEQMSGADVVAAIDTYSIGHEIIQAGERFRKSDPLVKKHPEIFKSVEA